MDHLRPGDVGFIIHHDNWISRAIGWFTQSRWSHVFLVVEKGRYVTYLSETCDFNVWIGYLEKNLKSPYTEIEIYTPDISDDMRGVVVKRCLENTGELYGWFQFISLGIRGLLKRIGIRIPNFIRQGIVCNQHVMYGYTLTDIEGISGVDPESMDQEDFYQMVKNNKRFRKIFSKEAIK